MRAFTSSDCRCSVVAIDNIDTDRIMPARFLTTTAKEGLGRHVFADWAPGRAAVEASDLLVVGHNFGCGSSREHAVWALLDAGVRVVVSTGFADIFAANALRNGLVPVTLGPEQHADLIAVLATMAEPRATVDLETCRLRCGDLDLTFPFDAFARHCITRGLDELGYLLAQEAAIEAHDLRRPAPVDTRGGGA